MEEETSKESGIQTETNIIQKTHKEAEEIIKETINEAITQAITQAKTGLTRLQSEMLTVYFEGHFETTNGLFNSPNDRINMLSRVSKELNVPVEKLEKLYKKAKNDYFTSVKRLPAETIINQINAEGQALKEEIYNTSTKDIVDKAKAITTVNEQLAKVNQLYDVAPTTNIFFTQNLNPEDLLNPKNFIDVNPEETGEGETNED